MAKWRMYNKGGRGSRHRRRRGRGEGAEKQADEPNEGKTQREQKIVVNVQPQTDHVGNTLKAIGPLAALATGGYAAYKAYQGSKAVKAAVSKAANHVKSAVKTAGADLQAGRAVAKDMVTDVTRVARNAAFKAVTPKTSQGSRAITPSTIAAFRATAPTPKLSALGNLSRATNTAFASIRKNGGIMSNLSGALSRWRSR
jgi:hypothetical protein